MVYRRWNNQKIEKKPIESLVKEQLRLQSKVCIKPIQKEIKIIAGCDSSFIDQETIFAVVVVFSYPELIELEVQTHSSKVPLPYIPGFLAFREVPNLLEVYKKVHNKPDLIMVDGHGIMHPRGLGIASHLGVVLDIPTIGVGKKKLFGVYEEPNITKGSYTHVYETNYNEHIGYALRSRDTVKPIFVSPGHLCNLEDALKITISMLKKHKLPEPTRIADIYTKRLKTNT